MFALHAFSVSALLVSTVLPLTADQKTAAMDAALADIKYHLAEAGVPEDVQALLFHKGFISLRLFSGLDETRADVRAALATEIGLKHDADSASRLTVARILGAWEDITPASASRRKDACGKPLGADAAHSAAVRACGHEESC